jgi:cytochrome P450
VACRKEENFEKPTEFIPERWLNENGEMCINKEKSSTIVVPFGELKR